MKSLVFHPPLAFLCIVLFIHCALYFECGFFILINKIFDYIVEDFRQFCLHFEHYPVLRVDKFENARSEQIIIADGFLFLLC